MLYTCDERKKRDRPPTTKTRVPGKAFALPHFSAHFSSDSRATTSCRAAPFTAGIVLVGGRAEKRRGEQEMETKLPESPPFPTIKLFFMGHQTLRNNTIPNRALTTQQAWSMFIAKTISHLFLCPWDMLSRQA